MAKRAPIVRYGGLAVVLGVLLAAISAPVVYQLAQQVAILISRSVRGANGTMWFPCAIMNGVLAIIPTFVSVIVFLRLVRPSCSAPGNATLFVPAGAAVAVVLLAAALGGHFTLLAAGELAKLVIPESLYGSALANLLSLGIQAGSLALIPCGLAVLVLMMWLWPRLAPDGHTRCGNCGHILKGLTEPRCPECGQVI